MRAEFLQVTSVQSYWIFFAISPFYIALLGLTGKRANQIVIWIVGICSLQALYAVCYHILGIYQFYTPNFGNRTAGTFSNPNTLYPVCLMTVPIAIEFSMNLTQGFLKQFYRIAAVICVTALVFIGLSLGF